MSADEAQSEPVAPRPHVGDDPARTVVWLHGEHDLATRARLSITIARAAEVDDADIVVDLSGVTFMDASTIGALVVAGNHLRPASRSLSVRTPSPRARRVLDLCGMDRLIDGPLAVTQPTALSSWVDVPGRPTREPAVPAAVPVRRRRASS